MPKASDKTSTYVVLRNLKHDKTSYSLGDKVDLTESQATPLLDLGVVKLPDPPAEKKA